MTVQVATEAREVLAELVRDVLRRGLYDMGDGLPYDSQAHAVADAVLDAGFTRHRSVSSVAELDALPTGSIIAELTEPDAPAIACKDSWGYWRFGIGNERAWRSEEIQDGKQALTVLYVPAVGGVASEQPEDDEPRVDFHGLQIRADLEPLAQAALKVHGVTSEQ